MCMTYPESVTTANIEKMRKLILNGADVHPGANFIIEKETGGKKFLKYGNRQFIADKLRPGDIIGKIRKKFR